MSYKKITPTSISVVRSYYAYLLVFWGFYRLLLELPAFLEDAVVKPLVWLLPLYFILKREKLSLKEIGLNFEKVFPAMYYVFVLGVLFSFQGFLINFLKYKGVNFASFTFEQGFIASIFISLITAFVEELAFRGFILGRLNIYFKNEWPATVLGSVLWSLIYIPIAVFSWQLSISSLAFYIILIFSFAFGASVLRLRTGSVIPGMLLHVLWQWPIILFR